MLVVDAPQLSSDLPAKTSARHIVVGVTHAQTCLTLTGRLLSLRKAGFRVTVVCSPGELLDRTVATQGAEAFAIPIQRGIAPLADIVSLVRLWRLLRRLKPDLTEFSTPKAGLLGTLAARLAGAPRRIYLLRGLKLETCTGWKRSLLLKAEQLAAASAHVVLCNSPSLRAEALALGIASANKLHVLGDGSTNGVDVLRFSPGPSTVREQLGLPYDARVVGFVGRLTRDKGVPELIEAFETIQKVEPQTHLLLVGWFDASEDALNDSLRAYIAGHPHIHCTGFVDDTAPYYRAMDIMVLPTWREGFPNVVLEAAASGLPVITTLSTGSRDSVLPEVTGLLIPPGDPLAISESVLRLLRNEELRKRMGTAARAWIVQHFVDERVLGLVQEYYVHLLDS